MTIYEAISPICCSSIDDRKREAVPVLKIHTQEDRSGGVTDPGSALANFKIKAPPQPELVSGVGTKEVDEDSRTNGSILARVFTDRPLAT